MHSEHAPPAGLAGVARAAPGESVLSAAGEEDAVYPCAERVLLAAG